MEKVILATNNEGKIRELSSLISGESWEFISPAAAGIELDVEETGRTFEENAVIKAKSYAKASNLPAIADDSGLEVDALNGDPGVFSARYAGPDASDNKRNEFLLFNLANVPWEKRTARFRCVIAIAFPEDRLILCKGECPGIIAFEPKGENGFGYDPVFYLPELGKSMAEISLEEKNRISHRAKAARKAQEFLTDLLRMGGS